MASFHFDHAGQFTPAVGDPVTDSSGNARHGTEGSGISWSGDGVRGGAMVTSGEGSGAFFSVNFAPGMIVGYHFVINGIPYIQINSATYVYYNGRVEYSEPFWARVTVDFETLELSVQGRQSSWSAADPWQLGAPESIYPRDKVRPAISNRTFTIREASADMAYGAYFSPAP